jgi:hypothetical protein
MDGGATWHSTLSSSRARFPPRNRAPCISKPLVPGPGRAHQTQNSRPGAAVGPYAIDLASKQPSQTNNDIPLYNLSLRHQQINPSSLKQIHSKGRDGYQSEDPTIQLLAHIFRPSTFAAWTLHWLRLFVCCQNFGEARAASLA